jgi:hypothetical protein
MVLSATDYTAGDVTAEIRIGNGAPVVTTFTIADATAPVIYSRPELDYSSQTLVSTFTENIYIYGDNFRGRGTGHTDYESVTKFFIYPFQVEDPQESDLVELPTMTQFDVSIQPGIADNPANEDLFFQTIPANTAVDLEASGYRIRVLNPDSGLYSDSPGDKPLIFVSE